MLRSVCPIRALVAAGVYPQSTAPWSKDENNSPRIDKPAQDAGTDRVESETEAKLRLIWENW